MTNSNKSDFGITLLLTGLPSSGKTTLANLTANVFRQQHSGYRVQILDGDEVRKTLNKDLGYSAIDRRENLRRISYVASYLARNGVVTLIAAVAPNAHARDELVSSHQDQGLEAFEVAIEAPLEVCQQRDVKGLYRQAQVGLVKEFTGISAVYEKPQQPSLRIDTSTVPVETGADMLSSFIWSKLIAGATHQ